VVRRMVLSGTPKTTVRFSRVHISTAPGGLPCTAEIAAEWDPGNPTEINVYARRRTTLKAVRRGEGWGKARRQNVEILWDAKETI
jgi:hypothetical protein